MRRLPYRVRWRLCVVPFVIGVGLASAGAQHVSVILFPVGLAVMLLAALALAGDDD